MPGLSRLWFGMCSHDAEYSSATDLVALIANQHGVDVLHHTFPDPPHKQRQSGQAALFEMDVAANHIVPAELGYCPMRVGVRGADVWRPTHLMVWGQSSDGAIVPIAAETDLSTELSTDAQRGRLSIPLRRADAGNPTLPIRRLLVLCIAAADEHDVTDGALELHMQRAGVPVLSQRLPLTLQAGHDQTNLYLIPDTPVWNKNQLGPDALHLSSLATQPCTPRSLFVFGLFPAEGRPTSMLPLVHLPIWPFGTLKAAASAITLPLV